MREKKQSIYCENSLLLRYLNIYIIESMKTITFDYTDSKNKKSSRVLLVASCPSTLYSGTDITPLEEDEQGEYIAARLALLEEYTAKIRDLDKHFDLAHQFRQFKTEGMDMSTLVVENF